MNSLLLKSGMTRKIKEQQVAELMALGCINKGVVVIEFKTDEEGIRLAKLYKRLAQNPSINLKVTFKKLT